MTSTRAPSTWPRASPAEAATALGAFVAGVDARDAAVLTRLAPDGGPAASDLLAGVAANAASLDLSDVSARYVDQVGTVATDGWWSAVAEVGWRVEGDDSDVACGRGRDLRPGRRRCSGSRVRGLRRGRVPLWLSGELSWRGRPACS